jgi:hypothetical protein
MCTCNEVGLGNATIWTVSVAQNIPWTLEKFKVLPWVGLFDWFMGLFDWLIDLFMADVDPS